MEEIRTLSESELYQWLKLQLEKRDFYLLSGGNREKMKEALWEILFYEQEVTIEDIEQFFIPFGQAGYLSPRQKFEIILYVLERDFGKSLLFFEGTEKGCTVTAEEVEEMYLCWLTEGRLDMSEEDKKLFFLQSLMDGLGLGVLEVLNRVAPDGILMGELCPPAYDREPLEERIAVSSKGILIRLPFLAVNNREEYIRIIKQLMAKENMGDLTFMEPVLDYVTEEGICITAIRPPAGQDWGVRILYGTTRKETLGWKK